MKKRAVLIPVLVIPMLVLPALPVTQDQSQDVIFFGDFSSSTTGEFPTDWSWRREGDHGDAEKARQDGVDVFRWQVQEETDNRYLHIRDEHRPGPTVSVFIETEDFDWKLDEHPILSWRWRVNEIPPGADERYTETNDSPASVSVIYGTRLFVIPITIKWVWSSTLPVGAVAYRPGRGRAHTIVLGSGGLGLGEWVTVERNIFEDYINIHGDFPPNEPKGINLSSDANRTPGGAADADYDDFKALSTYSPGFPKEPFGLLKQFMEENGDDGAGNN